MTEEDARLALLQCELQAIQNAIRGLDAVTFQIKGWCVTAGLAIGGFAAAYHKPALLVVGAGAVVGFCLVNCQFKLVQRAFIDRNRAIDSELRATGIMEVLKGAGSLPIVGTAMPTWKKRAFAKSGRPDHFSAILAELRLPHTFGLYLFVLACLALEALILA
ncbi:MAG TPA: hypothetical protein VH637_16565 [Streptosporangiaceae bacterium]|jgi:hypothetical protein